jgi:hypothetical protein
VPEIYSWTCKRAALIPIDSRKYIRDEQKDA